MIARLKGIVDQLLDGMAVIDVGGVGYLIFCSRRTLDRLGAPGDAASVHVETHVREDHIHLYGFADRAELDAYRILTTVQGVGGRHALALLSVLGPEELSMAIAAQDKAMLTRADGVGPKLAARICAELKDKMAAIPLGPSALTAGPATPRAETAGGVSEDAVSALVNLGYGRSEAFGAVARAARELGDGATVQALIPAALKELG
ncbi:MAG: Holliday junction branch migration protein RuvA [Azospirillaceae bacterium]